MAIKGKGKTKARQQVRAPRRAAVEVPTPFAGRRWVQVTVALLVGAGIVWFFIWMTNGIRQRNVEDREATAQVERRRSVQAWKSLVESELAKVGTLGTVGAPPVVAAELGPAIEAIEQGGDDVTAIEGLADRLDAAADALDEYDLSQAIRDNGFDVGEASAITSSQDRFVDGLRSYASATRLTTAAVDLSGKERKEILDEATALNEVAAGAVQDAWNAYTLGLGAAGLAPAEMGAGLGAQGVPAG